MDHHRHSIEMLHFSHNKVFRKILICQSKKFILDITVWIHFSRDFNVFFRMLVVKMISWIYEVLFEKILDLFLCLI